MCVCVYEVPFDFLLGNRDWEEAIVTPLQPLKLTAARQQQNGVKDIIAPQLYHGPTSYMDQAVHSAP